MKTTLVMVITVRYKQNVDNVYENNTVVMVTTVRYQKSVKCIWKQHCCYSDYCPLWTKLGVYIKTTLLLWWLLSVINKMWIVYMKTTPLLLYILSTNKNGPCIQKHQSCHVTYTPLLAENNTAVSTTHHVEASKPLQIYRK